MEAANLISHALCNFTIWKNTINIIQKLYIETFRILNIYVSNLWKAVGKFLSSCTTRSFSKKKKGGPTPWSYL
jgi:hypothetical protein